MNPQAKLRPDDTRARIMATADALFRRIGFAKTAVKAAQDTEQASMAMNMTGLADAQKSLAGACQGCHMAHRERLADGSFRIK